MPTQRRWALSLADICLLLVAFFIVQQHSATARDTSTMAASDAVLTLPVATAFEPHEARLSDRGIAALADHRQTLQPGQAGGILHICVGQEAGGSARLDAWELAAARTAAVARWWQNRRDGVSATLVLDAPCLGSDLRLHR